MSLIAVDRRQQTVSTKGSVTKSLEIALSDFASILTDDERKQLQQIKAIPDASAALVFTAKLDASDSTRRGRSIGARVYLMLQSIQQFCAVVDTFVSSHPKIAALVWGSVKFTVLIAANIASYFASLADLFMSLNKLFPQYEEYKLLFPQSSTLQEAICAFHASIVQLCKQSILLTRQSWIRKVTTDLSGKLSPQIEDIRNCAKDVKRAIALAKATSDRQEHELQEQERKLANKHRNHLSLFVSRSQKELEKSGDWRRHRDQDLLRQEIIKLLDSFSTYDHQKNFHQARKRRHVNTAMWLFSDTDFIKWKDDEMSSVFFLTGKIGSGKTMLTSAAVEHLCCERKRPDELTTFVLSRFDDTVSLSAASVLRSIIRQCLDSNDLTEEIEQQLSNLKSYALDMETIKTLLQHCINKFATLYIVIDSLDEFETEERNCLLRVLSSVTSRPDSKAKLFLAGRVSILSNIRSYFADFYHKSTNCVEVQIDIEAYIRENIALRQQEDYLTGERLKLGDPAIAQEIVEALIHGANGMFLWVDFQIVEICQCTRDGEIREALSTLPRSIGETFNRAMRRILKRGRIFKSAINVFRWVAAVKRAFTLDELREALSYEPGTLYSIEGRRPNGLEFVPLWCENLVQVDEELQTVQFTHHSVRQHLLELSSNSNLVDFHIRLEDADHFIGEICVTYLNSNEFETELARKPAALPTELPAYLIKNTLEWSNITKRVVQAKQSLDARIRGGFKRDGKDMILFKDSHADLTSVLQLGHPFFEYARSYWLPHTHSFEEIKSKSWNLWRQMIHSSHALIETPWAPEEFWKPTPVIYQWLEENDHSAIFRLGRLGYVNILIATSQDENELSFGLLNAAKGGHLEVVQLLLDANATAGYEGRTSLQAAAGGGHLEVVQLLLDMNADINSTAGYEGRTALQAVAGGGHLEVVQRLLYVNADVNAAASASEGRTALQAAAGGGHPNVVQLLLDVNADVNAAAGASDGRTALQAAAEGGHLKVVQRLLDAKANVDAAPASYGGRTALQAAAEGGYLEVVQRLLDANANVNAAASQNYGLTALQAAVDGGHLQIIALLKSAGART